MTKLSPPLPELNVDNTAFWTGGSAGELLINRCDGCDLWIHPPVPTCRRCGNDDVVARPVTGSGEVLTCTVNHQEWLPGMVLPYILAIVELDEQKDLRLTTRLVDCDPDEVGIGMRVRVTFEQREDVWLPLFRPEAAR
ncbi:Zn-ribbon domain-containing OB-fold protein [Rhodococcus sp. NPDC057014]|uniref:Zn-ribbon domain-containing OB-fold protein n=1 Tax=Rhodococcus sp. NPDC057014 TaxID=3346000 RepID=UPI00362C9B8F